jgi:hypothetical protein
VLGDQLAPRGDAVSCGCGCGGNGCCNAWVLRKGYAFKKRLKVINKTTGALIDFTGRRVIAQVRQKRNAPTALFQMTTDAGQITAGNGFIELNLPIATVETLTWSSGFMEIAVEWTPGVPEFQFATTARVDVGLRPLAVSGP